MNKYLRKNKSKGLLFSLDAIFALIVVALALAIIWGSITIEPTEMTKSTSLTGKAATTLYFNETHNETYTNAYCINIAVYSSGLSQTKQVCEGR